MEQIESLVSQLFSTLPEVGQTMFKLWLGLNLTQAEIAAVLQPNYLELQKQYQVARQLAKYNRSLLKDLLEQCYQLNPALDDAALDLMQESLKECLQAHCKRLLYIDLEDLEQLTEHSYINRQLFIQAFENQLEKNLSLPSLKFVHQKLVVLVDESERSQR